MSRATTASLLLAGACLSACAPAAGMAPAEAVLEVRAAVPGPSRLLALFAGWDADDLDHVRLDLRNLDAAGTPVIATGSLERPVATRTFRFGHLRSGTRYRVEAAAYLGASEAASAVSEPAAADFALGTADYYQLGVIPLQLVPRMFDVRPAGAGIAVTDGSYTPVDHTP